MIRIQKKTNPSIKQLINAVGALIYLGRCTRPDNSFAVAKASKNSENPKYSDWKKVMNILKYSKYTKNFKITYKGQGEIVYYTDSDFGGDPNDRKSTLGYIVLVINPSIKIDYNKKNTTI